MDHEQNIRYSNVHELQQTHNPEELSYIFIEMLQNRQYVISKIDWQLLDSLIDNQAVPEECAQQLLCIKVLSLMQNMKADIKSADIALTLLDRLTDPEYRLACFSRTYFELVLLKAEILFFQEKYLEAYEYANGIYDTYISEPEFNDLQKAEELKNGFKIKMALAAHFAEIEGDISYRLFVEVLLDNRKVPHFKYLSCNIFIIFGYECFRQKKYDDALKAFEQVSVFLRENNLITPLQVNTRDLVQEMIAMRLLSKKMLDMNPYHEEILEFCNVFTETEGMSDKNKMLRTHVIDLLAAEVIAGQFASAQQQPVTPMYTAVRQEQSKGAGRNEMNKSLNKQHTKNDNPRYG